MAQKKKKNLDSSNAILPSELLDTFKHHHLLQTFEDHLVYWVFKGQV